jgi:hypothetical protein
VWKVPQQQPQQDRSPTLPNTRTVSGSHLDPTSTAQSGKSFFGRIRVVVRCRPLQRDTEGDHTDNRIHTHGDEVLVCEKNNPTAARSYRFDRVLPPDADQVTTFAEVAPLVDHVLDGFHATVFAYGQTGSGKTFTMDGLRYVARGSGNNNNSGGGGRSTKAVVAMVPDPEGTPVEQHGIMPRMIQLLYDRARARQRASGSEAGDAQDEGGGDASGGSGTSDGVEYTFRCSYYQIYNEKIADLLRVTGGSPSPTGEDGPPEEESGKRRGAGRAKRRFDDNGLRVRWQKGDVFKVENLFVCSCASPDEMREMLFTGIRQKVVSSHMMNYQSSRSHCVFTIYVECRSRKSGELRSQSELSLVDLAGSEKIGLLSSSPSAKLVKESIDINTSLLALGKVIMALSSNSSNSGGGGGAGTKPRRRLGGATSYMGGPARGRGYGTPPTTAHIPYRDSKLTMLLKHALGGNSLTTMIACISPSDRYVEETTSTLLYAGRAKYIRNAPRVNEDATATLIRQLREEIAQLKAELGYYREMAAKTIGQQEAQVHICGQCGAVVDDGGGEIAVVGPLHNNDRSVETAVATREAEQLADSLIAACDMLKNMMQVNAELRDSYDAVREVQMNAERREADLNAENLALRERLSVLEAIVLQDDDDDDEDEQAALQEDADKGDPSARGSVNDAFLDSATREALETARQAVTAAAVLRANGGGYRDSDSSTSLSPPPRPKQLQLQQQFPPGATTTQSTPSPTSGSPARSTVSLDPPLRPPVPPVRARPVGVSTSKEEMPPVVSGSTNGAPAFRLVTPVTAAAPATSATRHTRSSSRSASPVSAIKDPTTQGRAAKPSKKRSKSRRKKKYHVLARRLKEYEQHYRAPQKAETYEDFYHPQRTLQSKELVVPGVPPIRASAPEIAQSTVALEDMKVMVSKLPKNVVQEYVPASLLRPGLFGSLAFGGGQKEKAEFEQHRSDRASRLRALQQRQQELYQQVHQAVRDVSLPQEPPPEEQSESDTQAVPGRGLVSSQPAPAATRKLNGSRDGGTRFSSEQSALYDPVPPRAPTAPYNDTRGSKKGGTGGGSRRSTDSLTRLLEYLDKERPQRQLGA